MRKTLPALLLLGACSIGHTQLPLPEGFLALEGRTEEATGPHAVLGCDLVLNDSGSLLSLEIQPGCRISRIEEGGAADLAGLQVGDTLLSFEGVRTDDPERIPALLRGRRGGEEATLRAQRGAKVFEVSATLQEKNFSQARILFWVDRALLRAAFEDGKDESAFPVVVEVGPDSPLSAVGVGPGDSIQSFQGSDPGSAAELVRRIGRELGPGDPFRIWTRSPGGVGREVRGRAWSPDRILTEFRLWPLFSWNLDPGEDREVLIVGDLILASVLKKIREGGETRWSICSVFSWKTGIPELEDAYPSAKR